jgi:hypothetical protein
LRATDYRDHAARPRYDVAVNQIRPSLSRKPVDLPECNTARTATAGRQTRRRRLRWAEPEVVFRIHVVAPADGEPPTGYRDQAVEVALAPNPTFPAGKVGTLTRRVSAERVVRCAPPRRSKPKPPRGPKLPRVVELLRKALEWQGLLESGETSNQAAIARREGITRARVTQVMGLLRLAPEIQEHILSLPDMVRRPAITERALRPIAQLQCPEDQLARLRELIGDLQ